MGRRRRESETDARALPWATYVLACALALGFAFVQTEALEIAALEDTKLSAASEFFQAHPYLELPALLESRVDRNTARRLAMEDAAQRRKLGAGIPAGRVESAQAELDEMVGLVASRLASRPEQIHGLYAQAPTPIAFASHPFVHGAIPHFAIVLLLLLLLGHHLEAAWGSAGMLGVTVVSTLAGAGCFVLQHPNGAEPLIGGSGLVAGLLAAYAVSAARAGQGLRYGATLLAGALALVLPSWLGHEWSIARGFGSEPAVIGGFNPSHWAVAGGFAAGAVWAAAAALLGRRIAPDPEVSAASRDSAVDADLKRALQDRRSGAHAEAFRRLEAILRRDPQHVDASLAFWEVCNELGRQQRAAPSLLRVLRDDVQQGNSARAVHYWLELVRCELDGTAEPALLLRMASLLRTADEEPAAVRALHLALQRADDVNAPSVAGRVARDAESLDPALATEAAWKALGCLEIDLEERQALEALLGRLAPAVGTRPEAPSQHAAGAEYRPAAVERAVESALEGEAIALESLDRELEIVDAIPLALDEGGVLIEAGGSRKRVRYDRVEAMAVAAVEGISHKPVLVIDLLLNWKGDRAQSLKTLRLRTDRFDPRSVVKGKKDALDAVRLLTRHLAHHSGAMPLPDQQSIRGMPFAAFKSLHDYHRDVLQIDDGEDDTI